MAESDSVAAAANGSAKADHKVKPEKPDEVQYKADLTKAEKEHAAVMEKLNALKAKIDLTKPPAKGSPVQQRQQELRSQLSAIRQQQSGLKNSKGNIQEKIRALDGTLKSRIAEQKNARGKIPYKNVEEVDREIQRLEKQVDTGTMRLVDEKKALADISSLRKQRKGFSGFDEAEKGISDIKAQISELRKGLEDPEAKALSEKYTAIAKELDSIKAEQDEAYSNINALRDERSKIQAEQQEKYAAIRAIKDVYYGAKKAFADYEHEAYRVRKERQKAEKDSWEKERRKKLADKKLEEANEPAYMDEILTAEGLIRYFDPAAAASFSAKSSDTSKFAAQAQRTVDESGLKGTRVMKKDQEEENYFMGTGGKKGKKGRKSTAPAGGAPASEGKFNLSMGVIEELSKVKVEPPMSQADVPAVVGKLQEKLKHWRENQERQTKENVAKAQKEIDRLESESLEPAPAAASSSTSSKPNGRHHTKDKDGAPKKVAAVNGEATDAPTAAAALEQEKDAVADVAKELKEAAIEDAKADGEA